MNIQNMPTPSEGEVKSPHRKLLERDYQNHSEWIDEQYARAHELPLPIETDTDNGKVGDFLVDLRQRKDMLEEIRKTEKYPYLEGCKTIDNYFGDLRTAIDHLGTQLKAYQSGYNAAKEAAERAERARIEEESRQRAIAERMAAEKAEAERRAAEARAEKLRREAAEAERKANAEIAAAQIAEDRKMAEAAAELAKRRAAKQRELAEKEFAVAGALAEKAMHHQEQAIHHHGQADFIGEQTAKMKPADFVRSHSASGRTTQTVREKWVGIIDDIDAIPLERLRAFFKRDHIQQAINTYVDKGNRELPGVVIKSTRESVNL